MAFSKDVGLLYQGDSSRSSGRSIHDPGKIRDGCGSGMSATFYGGSGGESENEVESENHPKSYICGKMFTIFEGFLEIAGTGMSGLIAQFSKYHFWNLWEIWDRNMWTNIFRRNFFIEKNDRKKKSNFFGRKQYRPKIFG